MLAGEDLGGGEDVGVDEGLIDPQECLVSAGADPGGLSTVLGADVGHGRRLGVPVGHVQDGPAQLSFLKRQETYSVSKSFWSTASQNTIRKDASQKYITVISH